MSAADWEEIRLLAADFQRAQLSSTVQRLSERNCVEIVNKLIELKLIDIIYTQDGKEYITRDQLATEIRDELYVRGGRINLGELQQITNVDYSHVEASVKQIVSSDKQIQLVLGDLISRTYLNKLAHEINDQLQEQGHVTISELAKIYDLPGELLSQVVQDNLDTVITAYRDATNTDYLYTQSSVTRHRARLCGVFSAITRPTPLSGIRHKMEIPGDLFYVLLEKLISTKRIRGSIYGGRHDKATYNPDIYSRTQNEWVDNFYSSNGYLEYDALTRLGIADPKGFIKRRYESKQLSYLATCCVGAELRLQLEASVEEAIAQGTWIDIMPLVPSVLSDTDVPSLLSDFLKTNPTAQLLCDTVVVSGQWMEACRGSFDSLVSAKAEKLLCDTVVVSGQWMEDCRGSFDSLVSAKAEKDVISNPALFKDTTTKKPKEDGGYKEQKKENRRKKAAAGSGSTKSGGGTQGREIRTKSTKKKSRGQHIEEDSDDDIGGKGQRGELEFMTPEEIETVLRERNDMDEATDELITEIASLLHRPLSKLYQERATALFLQSSGAATTADRRKTHEDLQDKISGLWTNVKLFEKGIGVFSGKDDIESQLVKHLLKTVSTTIVNHVTVAIATDHMITVANDAELTIDSRQKVIAGIPEPSQSVLMKLHTSLNGKELEPFFESLESVCDPKHLGILLRKPDKKKERPLLSGHRESLLAQLSTETDPAMTLHLSVTLLLLHHTHHMIHAPGRCIPSMISHLAQYVDVERQQVLQELQELVILHLKAGDQSNVKERLANEMAALVPKVKDIAMTPGKVTTNGTV